jgi:hypothetical protein
MDWKWSAEKEFKLKSASTLTVMLIRDNLQEILKTLELYKTTKTLYMLICKLNSASTLPAMSICDNLQEILKTLKLYKTKTWHLYK